MEQLKVAFVDWWGGFPARDNYFFNLLSQQYEVVLSDDPDVVFFSAFGAKERRNQLSRAMPGLRVFYTGENVRPDFDECDLAISFDRLPGGRNYRLPLWALADRSLGTSLLHVQAAGADLADLIRPRDFRPRALLAQKSRFCNFVYSARAPERIRFLDMLSSRKPVDCAGRVRHTLRRRGLARDGVAKLELQRQCKFTIAFENTRHLGYVTEKLLHPLLAGSVPIYWGAPDVILDFNPRCFIDCADFDSFEAVVDHVLALDQDDERYLEYLRAPPFRNNRVPTWALKESVLRWLTPHLERARCHTRD